jgi:hypothetical protein
MDRTETAGRTVHGKVDYAFSIQLWAICRVQAGSEAEARRKMLRARTFSQILDLCSCIDICLNQRDAVIIESESGEDNKLIEIDSRNMSTGTSA